MSTSNIPTHEDVIARPHEFSTSRIEELLDYATCYGDFNAHTPNGTTSDLGSPMNDERRIAIVALEKILEERGVDVANLYNFED